MQLEDMKTALHNPKRLSMCITPTPIQKLSRLSEQFDVNLFCKRDDLTGFGFGGNKIRKLEFLLQDALDRNCDTIVTCGSNQSNWCRMAATTGKALGLNVHLVLGGGEPAKLTGNLLLNQIVGAQMHYLQTTSDDELENAAKKLTGRLALDGWKPNQILMGGSTGLGTFGYIEAFKEILAWEKENDLSFAAIVLATGSGGTQAGLVAGQALNRWHGKIIGMSVSRNIELQTAKVRKVLADFDNLTGECTASAEIITEDAYVGGGYRMRTEACAEAIELFARNEGLFLDEVYTGKAASGLIDYCRKSKFAPEENVLFLHTGGAVQLFE